MLKRYKFKNTNKRVKAIENIIIETESINEMDNPSNSDFVNSLNKGCQPLYDSKIAEYFLECLITYDLKTTTDRDKIDV